ncbi:Gfo/Idh/MocA family oxidoreductase [Natronoglomus mannanivorans]|uniref:Gfo/Idh/MocA family oxidoreductase n=1 Tax=Natronoglomus mannanivorans TaxID=2979990 RepID=A0AAP3E3T3_9EURY|nr:Gfo/Idh/MocA family oxidoreductase [Halobacteria archaeon AArc-xg1-1]
MDIGFIGAGKMAGTLMEKVDDFEGAEITAICDIDEEAARAAAKPRNAAVYTDHGKLYDEEPLDAVVVAIPPFAYDDQVTLAADRGIDVFVEKPVALKPEQGRATLEAIEEAGIVTGTGYVFRYDEITEKALELLADREIAMLTGRYWSGLLASPWGNELDLSGGEIVTRTTHVYDLVRYLGGEVERVTAASTDRIGTPEIDYPDATTATLTHENGIISTVSSAVTSPEWTAELDVVGDDIHLHLDYTTQELTGTIGDEEVHFELPTDRYGNEIHSFLEAVRRGDPTHVRSDYADALRTLSLNWTVIDAAETGEPAAVGETRRS